MIPASDPWLLTINKSNICDLKEKEKEKKKKEKKKQIQYLIGQFLLTNLIVVNDYNFH